MNYFWTVNREGFVLFDHKGSDVIATAGSAKVSTWQYCYGYGYGRVSGWRDWREQQAPPRPTQGTQEERNPPAGTGSMIVLYY